MLDPLRESCDSERHKYFFYLYVTVSVYLEHIFMYSNSLGENYVVRRSVFK